MFDIEYLGKTLLGILMLAACVLVVAGTIKVLIGMF